MWESPDTPSNRGKQFMLSLYNPEMKRFFPTGTRLLFDHGSIAHISPLNLHSASRHA